MAVLHVSAQDAADQAEPLTVDAAFARSHSAALSDSEVGAVGLEVETHLVDLDHAAEAVPWDRVEPLLRVVGAVADRSAVSLEPGGQLELSGSPEPDILSAVTHMRHDGVSAPLEDMWPRTVEAELEKIVEQLAADRRHDEQDRRMLVMVQPQKQPGNQDDHRHDRACAE